MKQYYYYVFITVHNNKLICPYCYKLFTTEREDECVLLSEMNITIGSKFPIFYKSVCFVHC